MLNTRTARAQVAIYDNHYRNFIEQVRLACPEGSPECRDQAPPPVGDGCGEESWFSRAEAAKRKKAPKKGHHTPPPSPPLPARCAALLQADAAAK